MDSDSLSALLQLALNNFPIFLIICVLLIATGGGTVALIQSIAASRRGIKGDALVKEKNSIDGFIGLSTIQETTITRQEKTIAAQGAEIETLKADRDSLNDKYEDLSRRLDDLSSAYRQEIDYSNALEADRIANGRPAMQRPYIIKISTPVVQ